MFTRLINLYKKNNHNQKTQLEDYVTEILVSILEPDLEILDKFVNDVLKIEGSNFKINSQIRYYLKDDINCIIDIVIKNENIICFLENKVNSSEGYRQLERYTTVLNNIKDTHEMDIYLRYCTKYYDRKNIINIDFYQLRWRDIYKFLNRYDDKVIRLCLKFLKENGLGMEQDFKYEDLITMKNIATTIKKMDECFSMINSLISEQFGRIYKRDYASLKQIPDRSIYSIWTDENSPIIGDTSSFIEVGFVFEEEEYDGCNTPSVFVAIVMNKDNCKYKFVDECMKQKVDFSDDYNISETRYWRGYEKPLCEFISSAKQKEDICDWIKEKLDKINLVVSEINLK